MVKNWCGKLERWPERSGDFEIFIDQGNDDCANYVNTGNENIHGFE